MSGVTDAHQKQARARVRAAREISFRILAKARKLGAILIRPSLWRALSRGVAPGIEHIHALKRLHVGAVIDVGAHNGQFTSIARYLFPNAELIAFEPLVEARARFSSVAAGPNVTLHGVALGSTRGERRFHIMERSDSSSLLSPVECQTIASGVRRVRSETVPVELGSQAVDFHMLRRPILIKIDVQGGELEVLRGFGECLTSADYIYVELSFVELYEGQPLAAEVVSYLDHNCFVLIGVFNIWGTEALGCAQADFLFRKRDGACNSNRYIN